MKLLLLLTLSIFAFAINLSTDINNFKTNADEIFFVSSISIECNLYIEQAGQYLLLMNEAEQTNNQTALGNTFTLFLDHSNQAIAICRDVSTSTANELIDVQINVEQYYKSTYK